MQLTGDPRRIPNEPGGAGVKVMDPWPYNYKFGDDEEEITRNNLQYLEEVIMYETRQIAAAVHETMAPMAFLRQRVASKDSKRSCPFYGILMICDEVMAGWGRSGKLFAFEHYDFVLTALQKV